MTEETSLDQFLDDSAGASTENESAEEGAAGPEPEDEDEIAASIERATSTFRWAPDGADCSACDATVERLWRDDEGLVCADCKEW